MDVKKRGLLWRCKTIYGALYITDYHVIVDVIDVIYVTMLWNKNDGTFSLEYNHLK